ncbi:5486_t:CDS:2, partial [Acaulospora morrowiae]
TYSHLTYRHFTMNYITGVFNPSSLVTTQGVFNGLAGFVMLFRPDLFVPELASFASVVDKPATVVAYKYSGALLVALGHYQTFSGSKGDPAFVRNTLQSRVALLVLCGALKYIYDQMPFRIIAFSAVDLGLSLLSYLTMESSSGTGKRTRHE